MTTTNRVTVGQPAPDFDCHAVVDSSIKEISLESYKEANHWLILIFFPKAWSFVCPTEIRAFSARLEEFLYTRSCAIAFASTDNEYSLRAWNAAPESEGGLGGVHVPLISDSNHTLSRNYGVLIEEQGIAQRALFIIDPKGTIRGITVNDADVGRSVDEAQRVLDALTFKDEFGEGCPVDWKKGDQGIDLASKTRVDGPIVVGAPAADLRKSWTGWARPALNRAWSNASQASTQSIRGAMTTPNHNRVMSAGAGQLPTLKSFNASNSSLRASETNSPLSMSMTSSPMVRPTMGARPASTGMNGPYEPFAPVLSPMSAEPGRMEMQMEEAMARQRIENIQAAMANQRLETGSLSDVGVANTRDGV